MKRLFALLVIGLVVGTLGCTRSEDSDKDSLVEEEDTSEPGDVEGEDTVDPGMDLSGEDMTDPEDGVTPPDGKDDDATVTGTKVKDLQMVADGLNCPAGTAFLNLQDNVELKGVIVTAGLHSATDKLNAFFVADAEGGEYSGIKVVVGKAGNPPAVQVGDVLDISGSLKEYYCVTELEAKAISKKDSGKTPVVSKVAAADIAAESAESEKWEGVLVEIGNAPVSVVDSYGGFTVEGGALVDNDIFGDMPRPKVGCKYTSITGVLDYTYSKYRLLPRGDADLVLDETVPCEGGTTAGSISDLQSSSTSTTCTDQAFVNAGAIALEGAVIASPRFVASANKYYGYFLSDGTGGANSGVLLLIEFAANPDYAVGTVVDVEGEWTEYYCLTEINAEKVTVKGSDGTVPEPVVVAEADLISAGTAEQWEGVLVAVENVKVESKTQYGEAVLEGGLLIDTDFGLTTEWVAGTSYSKVVGFVTYSFSKYRIMPRTDADLIQ